LGGVGGTPLVAGARWSFRGKDAGSVRSRRLWARLRTQHRGEQRVPAAQSVFRQALLLDRVQDAGERTRHGRKVERLDEVAGVADLAATAASHEASQLLVGRLVSPGRLLLEGAEGDEIAVLLGDAQHLLSAERADQLRSE